MGGAPCCLPCPRQYYFYPDGESIFAGQPGEVGIEVDVGIGLIRLTFTLGDQTLKGKYITRHM